MAEGGSIQERAGEWAKWFGPRLKELRAKASLTQKALADLIGIAQSRVASYESDSTRYVPSWETVIRVALALDVSVEAFLRPPASAAKNLES